MSTKIIYVDVGPSQKAQEAMGQGWLENEIASRVSKFSGIIRFLNASSTEEARELVRAASDAAMVIINISRAEDIPDLLDFFKEIKNIYGGKTLVTSRYPFQQEDFMKAGCDLKSPIINLPSQIIKALGLNVLR